MADPLSIATGVAGLVSFGLQICKGLMDYYEAWKGYEADVTTLHNAIANLVQILRRFEERLSNPAHMKADAVNTVLENISSCREGLSRLGAKLEKVKARSGPVKIDKIERFKRRAMYPFKTSTIAKLQEIVSELRQNLMSALGVLQLDNSMLTAQKLDEISSGIAMLQDTTARFQLNTAIRDWLKAPDPSSNYNMALGKRESTTGEWFILSNAFNAWQRDPASVLWLHGGPGCGKTVLSSTIITATKLASQKSGDGTVLYYFFDFNDPAKQQAYHLLTSLVQQLAIRDSQSQTVLEKLYDVHEGLHRPTLDELLATLREMVSCSTFSHVYVILDALDECKDTEMLLIKLIQPTIAWNLPQLHLLATSRRNREIEAALVTSSVTTMPIENDVVDQDIRTFVTNEILRDHWWDKWSEKVRLDVIETLVSKARGMFRWVVCQLVEVRLSINVKMLKRLLNSLPKTLDDTYSRVLGNIDGEYIDYAIRLLPWLCFSFRPTSLFEANETLAMKLEHEACYDEEELLDDPYDMQQVCSSLLTITADSQPTDATRRTVIATSPVIRLAHYSVKEYLVSGRLTGSLATFSVSEKEAHTMIAEVCIRCLLRFNEEGAWTSEATARYPLAQYAAPYWFRHLQEAVDTPASEKLHRLALQLLSPGSAAYASMLSIFDVDSAQQYSLEKAKEPLSPLYFSCAAGLPSLAERLCKGGIKPLRQQNSEGAYGTALKAAICRHDLTLIRTLLANNISLSADRNIDRPYKVIRIGPYTIIEPATQHGHSPLVVAAEEEEEPVIELILDHMPPGFLSLEDCPSALDVLVSRPHRVSVDTVRRIIRLLSQSHELAVYDDEKPRVRSIADITVENNDSTPEIDNSAPAAEKMRPDYLTRYMIASIRHCNLRMLEALLAEGADANVRVLGYTILYEACKEGYTNCVEALIEAGADIHATSPEGSTDLQINSARPGSIVEKGETALHAAARCLPTDPHDYMALGPPRFAYADKLMQYLLDLGGDPDAPNSSGATPASLWYLSLPLGANKIMNAADLNKTLDHDNFFTGRQLPNTWKAFEVYFRAINLVRRAIRRWKQHIAAEGEQLVEATEATGANHRETAGDYTTESLDVLVREQRSQEATLTRYRDDFRF